MNSNKTQAISPENLSKIIKILDTKYGKVQTFLNHRSIFELLIAVILSAQTLDKTVNQITPFLFKKYGSPKKLAQADDLKLQELIRSINYYKTKSKHIKLTAQLIDQSSGVVPKNISELTKLPGVGRKVANVVLSDGYEIAEGVVVDTHIRRVSYRLGLTLNTSPEKVEKDLMNTLPKNKWINTPKQFILIGRNYCFSRKPNCKECPLNEYCMKNIHPLPKF